ncbi:MAG: 5-(carboxyamino)imidazole ribonucleotide mutase [Planctomycetaceae bacterium]
MSAVRIGFVMGSLSDRPTIEGAEQFLKGMEVAYEVRVLSAHRTPDKAREYALQARDRGLRAIVALAGMAAHLAGAMAASASVPVLGVPVASGSLQGFDALLATVQMPAGVPVATFAIGKAGATNAAVFACQMMAASDEGLARRLEDYRKTMRAKVEKDDAEASR